MQTVSSTFLTALRSTTKKLTWVLEFYHQDAIPGDSGFDPASDDFLFGFSKIRKLGETYGLTFRDATYDRKILSIGSANKKLGKELNTFTAQLSNMSRDMWGFERDYGFEGLICVVRILDWSVSEDLEDSMVVFVGRCEKVQNFDRSRETCSLTVKQIVNATDTDLLRRTFSPNDKAGRSPSDPLFEGFRFTARDGTVTYEVKVKKRFLFFFSKTKTERRTLQYSSHSDASTSTWVPLVLGRAQVPGIHVGYEDLGTQINFLTAFCDGYENGIASYENVRSVTEGFPIVGHVEKLGVKGGTGDQVNDDPSWIAAAIYSRLAYIRAYASGTELDRDDPAPEVAAIILGLLIPTPDAAGDFVNTEWSDNPVEQARWVLNSEYIFNLAAGWFDDAQNVESAQYCDHVVIDKSNDNKVLLPISQSPYAGQQYYNYKSTAFLDTEFYDWSAGGLSERFAHAAAALEPSDYGFYTDTPYNSDDYDGSGSPSFAHGGETAYYRRRYTSNVRIGEQMKALNFLYDILFPAANLYLAQSASGLISVKVNKPVDHTFMQTAASATDTSIAVQNVMPWANSSPGRILIGANLPTSEVRAVSAYAFSAGGQSVSVNAGASFSTSTLTNGSSTVAPYSTLTISSASGTREVTIDGFQLDYVCKASDSTTTVAGAIAGLINSHPVLNKYIKATWGKDATVLVQSREGTLTVAALENAHAVAIANPTTAPVCVVGGGGDLDPGTYLLAYSYQTASGETLVSSTQSLVVGSGQNIVTPVITPPAGTIVNWYCSVEPQGVRLHRVAGGSGASFTISKANLPTLNSPPEPYANLTSEEVTHIAMAFSDSGRTTSELASSNMLKGSFKFPYGNRQPSINQIVLKYRDAAQDFELTELTINDTRHQKKVKKVNKLEVDGSAIDSHHQAYRIGNQLLNHYRDGDLFHGLASDGEALLLEEGDVICVSDDSGEFHNELVRIEEVEATDNRGFPEISLIARRYRRWFYDDQSTEKLVPLPIVQTASPNRETEAPAIVASDTPLNTTVNFTVEDYSPTVKAVKWELDTVDTFDSGDYEFNIVNAEANALRTMPTLQKVTKESSDASATAYYVRQSVSTNGETFSSPSAPVLITFADNGDSGGVGMDSPPSGLSAVWNEGSGEADLQWTRGGGTDDQTLQRKLSTDPPSSWADVEDEIDTGDTTYSDSGLTKSQAGAVTYNYRLRDNTIDGWTNTASVVVPIADNPPSIDGSWDAGNSEVDLVITPGDAPGSGDYTIEHKTTGSFATLVTQAGTTYSHARTPGGSAVDNFYRVKRAVPSGQYSNTKTVTVPASGSPPTLNSVDWEAPDVATLNWTNNGGSGAFTLQVKKFTGGAWGDHSNTATSGETSGTVLVTPPSFKTLYVARVKRDDVAGWSNEVTFFGEP